MEDIVIIGFGGHAKSIADAIECGKQYHIVGYTDMQDNHCKYPYLGTDDALTDIYAGGTHKAVLGVGFLGGSTLRDKLVASAKEIGFEFPAVVDPSAIITQDAEIGQGTFVGKGAILNAEAKVGDFCIINTGAILEHECVVGDFSHVSVGSNLCGQVTVGTHSMVGSGATVVQCKHIGDYVVVGAGAVVTTDLQDSCVAVGVPAKIIKTLA